MSSRSATRSAETPLRSAERDKCKCVAEAPPAGTRGLARAAQGGYALGGVRTGEGGHGVAFPCAGKEGWSNSWGDLEEPRFRPHRAAMP